MPYSTAVFFAQRVIVPEYTDTPGLPLQDVTENYRELSRINRLFRFADPFLRCLPAWIGPDSCKSLSILDLGAGDGSLGRALEHGAAQRQWNWRVTSLELNPHALRLNPGGSNVCASVTALPFADNSFDLVIASQMTHHLDTTAEVIQHFKEARRVTRDGIYLNDIHRSPLLYGLFWFVLHLGYSRHFRQDGLISIRRGWRVREWQALAQEAGIEHAHVWLYHHAKVILQARKKP